MPNNLNRDAMCKTCFHVIGLTDSPTCCFPPEVYPVMARGRLFSGGKRHHELVASLLPAGARWIDITVPLDAVFEQYANEPEVVVFASGDPLFFGFAGTLLKRLPDAEIHVYPTFYSLQMLAHRLLCPYQTMRTVSLTGRPWDELDAALIRGEALIGILTDQRKTPATIAQRLLDYGYDNYQMAVGVSLGNPVSEEVIRCTLAEAITRSWRMPNCLILERTAVRSFPFGLPESEFELLDGRVNMITKMPIRLLTLSLLDLAQRHSFWDIGFCTGSVSIEAKRQFPHLQVTAFEQRPVGEQLMQINACRFGTPGIQVCMGDFLQADLSAYPKPDAVFIGGHGGALLALLERIVSVLQPRGVIVFNSVSSDSLELFRTGIHQVGRQITREMHVAIDSFHPITILQSL